MELNTSELSDDKLLSIMKMLGSYEFYCTEGYYVNVNNYFTQGMEFHHVEYVCEAGERKWYAHPEDVIGKLLHVDELFDELCLRGLQEKL